MLKGENQSCEALLPTTLTQVGTYLDPFICLIKHSCEANAWVIFEGNELRIRALRPIPIGTELSIAWYRGTLADWEAHRAILLENIDLDCKCVVCENRCAGPGHELLERLKKYDDDQMVNARDEKIFDEIQDTIRDMKSAGFGTANGMYGLYKHAISGYMSRGKTVDALKHVLELYYIVGPGRIPRVYPHFRIDTLFILICILEIKHFIECLPVDVAQTKEYELLPEEVNVLYQDIRMHLKWKLAADTAKYFGENSIAAKFEKATWMDWFGKEYFNWDSNWVGACRAGSDLKNQEIEENEASKKTYLESMMKLLNWAGIGVPREVVETLLL